MVTVTEIPPDETCQSKPTAGCCKMLVASYELSESYFWYFPLGKPEIL
jgi:hypothetical protein